MPQSTPLNIHPAALAQNEPKIRLEMGHCSTALLPLDGLLPALYSLPNAELWTDKNRIHNRQYRIIVSKFVLLNTFLNELYKKDQKPLIRIRAV